MMDTIYALSSGGLPSGVAIIRLSGPDSFEIAQKLSGLPNLEPRKVYFSKFSSVVDCEPLDEGLLLFFRGPASFTGEDVAEFQLHGGLAVVDRFMEELSGFDGTRLAEAGEFSKRAFENGRLDLTQAEGLADLIAAQTDSQRRLALNQSQGALREKLEKWRSEIVKARAFLDVEFDFSDEDDVPDSMVIEVIAIAERVSSEIDDFLDDGNVGEIVRDGFRVAILGPPNAGKSSLMNALAKREVAIVTDIPGTTRDVVEVRLDLDGIPIILSDTAGIRETNDPVELKGIDKAYSAADAADMVIWLEPTDKTYTSNAVRPVDSVVFRSKSDMASQDAGPGLLSVRTDDGLESFLGILREAAAGVRIDAGGAVISRSRHRQALKECGVELASFLEIVKMDPVLASEHLRQASDHIGRITGRVDVEDLLDVIFGEFCIGK